MNLLEYDAETNRYTATIYVGLEKCVLSFDRDRVVYGEKEGLEYLLEGIQTSIEHCLEYGNPI